MSTLKFKLNFDLAFDFSSSVLKEKLMTIAHIVEVITVIYYLSELLKM